MQKQARLDTPSVFCHIIPDSAIEGKIELQKKRKTKKYTPFQ